MQSQELATVIRTLGAMEDSARARAIDGDPEAQALADGLHKLINTIAAIRMQEQLGKNKEKKRMLC